MKDIFVVIGTTGEYSNRIEWPVMVYLDEAKAQEHVVNANHRAKELFSTRRDHHSIEKGANEFDPDMVMEYTGTSYFIYRVHLPSKE
jgi:hypothetical protein